MNNNSKALPFFAVWFLMVSMYILIVSVCFSLYSVTYLPRKTLATEDMLVKSIDYLKFALKDYPNDLQLNMQLKKNQEALRDLRTSMENLRSLKLSIVDIFYFSALILTSILYFISSVFIIKRKKILLTIIPIALACSLINLLAAPFYKLIKGFHAGFPHYGVFIIISIICYVYTFYYFNRSHVQKLFK